MVFFFRLGLSPTRFLALSQPPPSSFFLFLSFSLFLVLLRHDWSLRSLAWHPIILVCELVCVSFSLGKRLGACGFHRLALVWLTFPCFFFPFTIINFYSPRVRTDRHELDCELGCETNTGASQRASQKKSSGGCCGGSKDSASKRGSQRASSKGKSSKSAKKGKDSKSAKKGKDSKGKGKGKGKKAATSSSDEDEDDYDEDEYSEEGSDEDSDEDEYSDEGSDEDYSEEESSS